MPWRPLSRIAFAVAIYPFQPSSPADLPLELGDELYIIEEGGREGAWMRGYLVAPPSLLAGLTSIKGQTLEARVFSGIFPRCCVEIRELLGEAEPGDSDDAAAATSANHLTNGIAHHQSSPKRQSSILSPRLNGVSKKIATVNKVKRTASVLSHSNSASPESKRTDQIDDATQLHNHPDKIVNKTDDTSALPPTPESLTSADSAPPRPPAPVPMLKIGDETPTSESEPLVDEIGSCLREWHSTNLHELLLSRQYGALEKLSKIIHRVDVARRQLLNGVLTGQELQLLRERTAWDLVRGNKMLSNEVIVRDPKQRGRLLVGEDSVIELSKLQSAMGLLDKLPEPLSDQISLHHLLVQFKALSNHGPDTPQLCISLYVKRPDEPPRSLTETFALDVPLQEQLSKATAPGKLRTLFTDLTPQDTGEMSGSNSHLYLVVKFYCNQPFQLAIPLPSKTTHNRSDTTPSPNHRSTASSSPASVGLKGGRRSLMWAQSKLGSPYKHKAQQSTTLDSAGVRENSVASAESEKRPETPATPRPSTQASPQHIRKMVGLSVHCLDGLFGQKRAKEITLDVWSLTDRQGKDGDAGREHDRVMDHLMGTGTSPFIRSKAFDQLRLQLTSFISPDAEVLIRKTPTTLYNVLETPKMGFSGVPTKPRSDIYVTIRSARLPVHALLSHPDRGNVQLATSLEMKNIQLTLEVRKSTGDRIERCIHPTSSSPGHTAWRTAAVARGEAWNQTIKLVIPADEVSGAHLIMRVADAPGFPFALGWMPLWDQQAFVKDGMHSPLLYLYDKTTSSTENGNGRGAYLNYPWNSGLTEKRAKENSSLNSIATLDLESYLCSTVFSQDQSLLGILKWRAQPETDLTALLKQMTFVPEIEIVKVVGDVFDALFAILTDRSGNDEYEDLVFHAIVTVLSITHDRRFNFRPLVDKYLETRFNSPFATPCLIRSYLRLMSNATDAENARRLRETFKVGDLILKFIIAARNQQKIKEAGIGIASTSSSFNGDLRGIFIALEVLIRNPSPATIGSKTLAVQYMHTWLPCLREVYTDEALCRIASDFVDACSNVTGKLILHKLVLILNVSKSIGIAPGDLRRGLDASIAGWIAPYWGATDEVTDQWREQTRLCCSIVATQQDKVGPHACQYLVKIVQSYHCVQAAPPAHKTTFAPLFPSTYPFPTRPASKEIKYDENLIELASLLAAFQSIVTVEHFRMVGDGLAGLISSLLEVNMSILSGEGFPSSWLSLHVYHHRTIFFMLESMFQIMAERLLPSEENADDFDTDIWKAFFAALLQLVRSPALALETFPEQKRRAVWKIAGDVREQGAELLRQSWSAIGWETNPEEQKQYGLKRLGGFQVQYVPGLVAPILELCLSVHEGLRTVSVGILQSMVISEWILNEDLAVIQAEMIACLDTLLQSRDIGERAQQRLFTGELMNLFYPLAQYDEAFHQAIKGLVETIDELLDLLVSVHNPEATEATKIMHTLRLMDFLKDVHKEDIFVRYVHQLADVQAKAHNPTEAGLALKLHADLYSWNTARTVSALTLPDLPEQSEFERKEHLYFEMIKYFEEGCAWDNALRSYREVAHHYERSLFDFAKLARAERSMATIYEAIARGDDQTPRYFRVAYRGMGFPISMRDKHFVFQGNHMERLTSFTDRLLQQHPAAKVVPLGKVEEVEGQFLQISPVAPHKELEHPLYQRARVPQSIREYLLSSQPQKFSLTSRRHSPKTGVKDQWIEKTVYTTTHSFPTILRRSEIVAVDVIALSPLQTATERTTRKTSELVMLEKRIEDGDDSSFGNLMEAIKSSVDFSSPTSVAQYRELLPHPDFDDTDDESAKHADFRNQYLENALRMALLDHAATLRHCITLFSSPLHQATQYAFTSQLAATFAPELAILSPPSHVAPRTSNRSSPTGPRILQTMPTPTLTRPRTPSRPTSDHSLPSAPPAPRLNGAVPHHYHHHHHHHNNNNNNKNNLSVAVAERPSSPATSLQPPRSSTEQQQQPPSSPSPQPSPRNRLSLTFLKRHTADVSAHALAAGHGHLLHPAERAAKRSSTQSATDSIASTNLSAPPPPFQHGVPAVQYDTPTAQSVHELDEGLPEVNGDVDGDGRGGGMGNGAGVGNGRPRLRSKHSDPRPAMAASGTAGGGGGGGGVASDRLGSIRKRLSFLSAGVAGIGKRGSRGSFVSDEDVREEDGRGT